MNMSAEHFCIVTHDTNRHLSEGYGDPLFEYALDQIRAGRLGDWMVGTTGRKSLCHAIAAIAAESKSQFREEEIAEAMIEHCGDELRDSMERAA
jgi:hypothetical protein